MKQLTNKFINDNQDKLLVHNFRLSILGALVIILSFLLILRMGYLQFSQFTRYATLSLKNQMSIIPIPPSRGIIYDRNGVVLADNIPIYIIEIIPEKVKDLDDTLKKIQNILPSISDDDIEKFYQNKKQYRAYDPVPLKLKLTLEEVSKFVTEQYRFHGVNVKAISIRNYPLKDTAAHLLGYVGRINIEELKRVDPQNYRATNYIGKSGIEKFYEKRLHGTIGYQQVETNAYGRNIRTINKQPSIPGAKLFLTIDARLQQEAHEAFNGTRGAAVLINVKNGEVMLMASSPSFDPNLFVNGISNENYKMLSNEIDRPLYNRAVRGLYPPASTIKPYVALAGLDKNIITPSTVVYDPGWYRLPNVRRAYRCWRRTGHGVTNVKRAITVSCDTFFYQLGNKMGIATIENMLSQFGFGQLTHIDLHEEAQGLVPNPYWKRQSKATPWYPGDTLITSIGQGFMLATPLQLANAVSAMSQHGRRYRPHLLLATQKNNKIIKHKLIEEYPVKLNDPNNWSVITEAMQMVITQAEGTGGKFGRDAQYTVAGKTGTAQVFTLSQQDNKNHHLDLPAKLRDNTLFIAFAPVENPEVALAVLVENNDTASYVARHILDSYFKYYQSYKNDK